MSIVAEALLLPKRFLVYPYSIYAVIFSEEIMLNAIELAVGLPKMIFNVGEVTPKARPIDV